MIILNHQNVDQEEEAKDGKEGEISEGHQHALEVVPVGYCSSLIFGSGVIGILFEVDI